MLTVLMTLVRGTISAQSVMNKSVIVRQMSAVKLSQVFEQIGKAAKVSFVYNNRTVNADSIVNISGYRGTVSELMLDLLGRDYEMKETPGYLVIRYAPGRLMLEANMETESGGEVKIRGRLLDERDHKAVSRASIFEKSNLTATLTDENGSFEIILKKTGSFGITLIAAKENYRDTSLNMLREVAVFSKPTSSNDQFDPAAEVTSERMHHGLSGFLMGARHKIQDLNIGGMFQNSPYQISLTPGLSTHGLYSSQVIHRFSLNILGGYSAGVNGLEGAFLFNLDKNNVKYVQGAGLLNIVGGDVTGVQVAGLFNRVYGQSKGIQVAGLFNWNGEFTKGLQFAPLNISKKSGGFQVGIVNIADSADYTFGLVNIIKNGSKSLGIHTDESYYSHLNFRSGGRVVYGIVGLGFKILNGRASFSADRGLGVHILKGGILSLNAEGVSQYIFNLDNGNYQINTIRVLPVLFPKKRMSIFAGPSLNLTSWETPDMVRPAGWILKRYDGSKALNALSIGITGGVQLNL